MYHILLLHEMLERDCRMKEYLQLGGYHVVEEHMENDKYMKEVRHFDAILIESDQLELVSNIVLQIRKITQIPIIILSNRNDEWEKIRLFQNGIDDYLANPYWHGECMARLRTHIERYRRLTRPFGIIKVEGLEINALSRQVFRDGCEVEMRSKEFDVLLHLAQHMNEVVKKEDIYEAVWKDDLADGFYNSVAVHIKKIREKIEKDSSNPRYIETVWGVGYRFKA